MIGLHDPKDENQIVVGNGSHTIQPFYNCCSANIVAGIRASEYKTAQIWSPTAPSYTSMNFEGVDNLLEYFQRARYNPMYAVPIDLWFMSILGACVTHITNTGGKTTIFIADNNNKAQTSCHGFMKWCEKKAAEPSPLISFVKSVEAVGSHGTPCLGGIISISPQNATKIGVLVKEQFEEVLQHIKEVEKHKSKRPLPNPVDQIAGLWE